MSSQPLIESLPLSRQSLQLFPDYLQFLGAPESLRGLAGVSEVFLEMLELNGFSDFPEKAYSFQILAQEIVTHSAEFENQIPGSGTNRDIRTGKVLRGVLTHHPLYSLLYYQINENAFALVRLQQAFLTAIRNPRLHALSLKEHYLFSYSLAIRSLTDVPVGQAWLKQIDEHELCSLEGIWKQLEKLIRRLRRPETPEGNLDAGLQGKSYLRLIDQLEATRRLLKASTGSYVASHKHSGGKRVLDIRTSLGVRGRSEIRTGANCEKRVLGDPDDPTEEPDIYAINEYPKDPKILKELAALGIEPDEAEQQYEFIFTRHQYIPAYAQAFNEKIRARGAAKRMELQNQFLPLSTQMLNDEDLTKLSKLGGVKLTVYLAF